MKVDDASWRILWIPDESTILVFLSSEEQYCLSFSLILLLQFKQAIKSKKGLDFVYKKINCLYNLHGSVTDMMMYNNSSL